MCSFRLLWVHIQFSVNDLLKLLTVSFIGSQVTVIPNIEQSNFDIIEEADDCGFPMYTACSYFKKSIAILDCVVFFTQFQDSLRTTHVVSIETIVYSHSLSKCISY